MEDQDQQDKPKSSMPEGELEIIPEDQRPAIFTLGHWQHFEQHQCAFCPYDTLRGEATIREHVETNHPEQYWAHLGVRPVTAKLFDASGKPVTQVEI